MSQTRKRFASDQVKEILEHHVRNALTFLTSSSPLQ
jgi:hypothetical protein